MKRRSLVRISLGFVFAAIAVGFLIFMPTSHGESTLTKWTVQQGEEISLGNNLTLVVGKIENGKVEIAIRRASATPVMQQKEREHPAQDAKESDPCKGCCEKKGPTGKDN